MKIKTLALVVSMAAVFTAGHLAFAAGGPHDKAIKARQAAMQLYNFNTGILGAMAKEKMPYDAAIAAEAANNLNALAMMGQSQLWPAGSDNATDGNAKNRALPAIWETYPKIVDADKAFASAAAALAPVAGNGLAALQGGMGDVGASCKGCHDDFRAKKR